MKILRVLPGLCLLLGTSLAAEFPAGSEVVLFRDAHLYYQDDGRVARIGQVGERFTVAAAPDRERRVYLFAQDALGKETVVYLVGDALVRLRDGVPIPPFPPPATVPGLLTTRYGTRRPAAMTWSGGKQGSEDAVVRGLRYLARVQSPDGSWGKGYKAAMTGFALLSFLGHGETADSPEFGQVVKRAVDWIIENGQASEARLSMQPAFTSSGVYSHAIATQALCEYYAMTKDERVVELLTKAVDYIVAGQGPDGGWMYGYDKSESDTSVSGWQVQALFSALLTGLKLEGVDAALDNAMHNFDRVQGPKGGFGYRQKEDRYSLTGVGVYCCYTWKQDKDVRVRAGIQFLLDQSAKNYPVDYRHEKADLCAWYYHTLALRKIGQSAWKTWNGWFQDQIIDHQSPDGSWPPLAGKSAGGEIQRDKEADGVLFRTNLCVLMLEIYYRYAFPP